MKRFRALSDPKGLFVLLVAWALTLVLGFPVSNAAGITKTFDFEAGIYGSTNIGDPSGTDKTVGQTVDGYTLTIKQDQGNILIMDAFNYNSSNSTALSGNAVIVDGSYDVTNKLTLTVDGGISFDLSSLNAFDQFGTGLDLVFTTSKGAVTKTLTGDSNGATLTLGGPELQGITSVDITKSGGGTFLIELDSVVLDNLTSPVTPLSQVTGVTLSSSGVATWGDVSNESSYDVQLYKNGSPQGSAVNKAADTLSHDFLSAMRSAGAGNYTVRVTAKGDGVTYSDGAQSADATSQTVAQLQTVSAGLTWTGDVAHWTTVANATSYDVQLFKNGSALGTPTNVLEADAASGVDFSTAMTSNGAGTYTYKVTAKADTASLYLDAAVSAASNDAIKSVQLTQVTGLTLSANGIASWNDSANESSYDVQLFKNGVAQGAAVSKAANAVSHDFLAAMRGAGAGDYTIKVTAKGDGTYYLDSAASAASAAQTVVQLQTVTAGLSWSGQVAHWTPVSNAVSYDIQLFKGGSSVGTAVNVLAANATNGANFSTAIQGNGIGTYTFKVTAKGNSSLILDATASANAPDLVVTTLDAVVPTVGTLSASQIAARSLQLSWTAGSDNETLEANLAYKVVQSTTDNISSVADAESNGTLLRDWTTGLTPVAVSGLTPETTYYFNVLIKDEAGNTSSYARIQQTTLQEVTHTVTFVSNGGSAVASQQVVDGEKATLPIAPTRANYTFVSWYREVALTTIFDFNNAITAPTTLYAKWAEVTAPPSTEEPSEPSPTPAVPTPSTNTEVLINGQVFKIGRETTQKSTSGTVETTVQVDKAAILKQIDAGQAAEENRVQVIVTAKDSDEATVDLTGDIIKSLENKNFDLSIQKDAVNYQIPAKEFTIDAIANTLDVPTSQLQNISVSVVIKKPTEALQNVLTSRFNTLEGVVLATEPVTFELRALTTDTSGDVNSVAIRTFSEFVTRTLTLPNTVNPNQITTGVVFNDDGTFEHVPTSVYKSGDTWYAAIHSRSNSTYALVYQPREVPAVKNHWAEDAVNDMASRAVVVSPTSFTPDEAITRSTFIDYVVRGLGLYRKDADVSAVFKDVSDETANPISIAIGAQYGLVNGDAQGNYNPNAALTREEAMVILSRALAEVNFQTPTHSTLDAFVDADTVSHWALEEVQHVVSSGVVSGRPAQQLMPQAYMTQAEAAQVVRNLLIKMLLINEAL